MKKLEPTSVDIFVVTKVKYEPLHFKEWDDVAILFNLKK